MAGCLVAATAPTPAGVMGGISSLKSVGRTLGEITMQLNCSICPTKKPATVKCDICTKDVCAGHSVSLWLKTLTPEGSKSTLKGVCHDCISNALDTHQQQPAPSALPTSFWVRQCEDCLCCSVEDNPPVDMDNPPPEYWLKECFFCGLPELDLGYEGFSKRQL